MTEFPTIILKQVQPSFELYELVEASCYKSLVCIPIGFTTDFASVPEFLYPLFKPHKAAVPASVLHDYFYVCHPFSSVMNTKEERLFADKLFRDILIETGVSKFQAGIMYNAVRLFGKFRFENFGKSRKRVRLDKKLEGNRLEKNYIYNT